MNPAEKKKVKEEFLIIQSFEPEQYQDVMDYKVGELALKNMRGKLDTLLSGSTVCARSFDCEMSSSATSMSVHSEIEDFVNFEQKADLDALVFLILEALPNKTEEMIRGSVSKAIKLYLDTHKLHQDKSITPAKGRI